MKPVLQAILLADHVYKDRETGKTVVAGVFDRLCISKRFPQADHAGQTDIPAIPASEVRQAGSPYVYVNLREVRGKALLELRLVHLDSNEVFLQTREFSVECEDPLQRVELVIAVPPLPQVPGTYALELLCQNELIGSHRIVVQEGAV